MSAIPFKVLIAVSWLFTGLAVLLTAGRFGIRYKIIERLSWDDAAHLLGLLLLIAQVSIVSAEASIIYPSTVYDVGDDDRYEAEHLLFVRLNVAAVLVTLCCIYAIKMAFLLLYHRIFHISHRFIQAWWIVLGVVSLTFCILVVGYLTQCGSPSDLEHVGTFGLSMYHFYYP